MGHVFISYSHKNTKYAHRFADELQEKGIDVWIDERLDYGSTWPQEIQKQLDSCNAFIVIMSSHSFESQWVQNELNRAKRLGKPIYPLLLDGDGPWLSVESTQFADVRDGSFPKEKFYTTLERVITPITGLTSPQPTDERAPSKTRIAILRKLNVQIFAGIGVLTLIVLGTVYFSENRRSSETETPESQPAVTIPTEVVTTEPTEEIAQTEAIDVLESASPNEFVDGQGVTMVFVPSGNFIAGSDTGYDDEKPVHTIYLDDFYIDKYEVTNALYLACAEEGSCQAPEKTSSFTRASYYKNPQFDNYPVIFVDWDDAKAYCVWRGIDLPTEAQWEKAARGEDGRTYPWGGSIDGNRANFNDTVQDTTAVGSYENGKSPYGAYDMAGNVWEWVADWYSSTYYLSTSLTNPSGPATGEYHVLRGGSWHDDDRIIRTSNRGWSQIEYFYNTDFGFRCAMDGTP
jgi:formylglycine-generating enzyme required for sulfatase activity